MPPKLFSVYRVHEVLVVVLVFYQANGMRDVVKPGPTYPPTLGEVWPVPQFQTKSPNYFLFEPLNFKFNDTTGITEYVECKEYKDLLKYGMEIVLEMYSIAKREDGPFGSCVSDCDDGNGTKNMTYIRELKIKLAKPIPREKFCPIVVPEDMNEAYKLNITDVYAELTVYTVWGVIRGITTFTQLFYIAHNESEVRVNSTVIEDYPRFAYRGMMLDTSRHYISINKIKQIITGMRLNKLNVLHWHIADDPSCPHASDTYPTLSKFGAFNYEAIYSRQDILKIILYAKAAGVRVIPGYNVPGHVQSWGVAFPHLLTRCNNSSLGPLNFLENGTFEFLKEYFDELKVHFEDDYIHIGGGDVDFDYTLIILRIKGYGLLRLNNSDYREYMKQFKLKTGQDLLDIFIKQLFLEAIPEEKKAIVWQEVVAAGPVLPNGTIVHVWQDESAATQLSKGYKVLFSTCFQFDSAQRETNLLENFYNCDPEAGVNNPKVLKNLVGGEAVFWSDRLDDTNINSKMWPRGAAMAERLWSSKDKLPTSLLYERLNEQICRMKRLYIDVNPLSAGHCIVKKISIK